MSVKEIQIAISQLPRPELKELAAWFEEFQAELWDKQIEADLCAGRLDTLIREAEKSLALGGADPCESLHHAAVLGSLSAFACRDS